MVCYRGGAAGQPPKKKRRSGCKFNLPEKNWLLDCIEEVLPAGLLEWDEVLEKFNELLVDNNHADRKRWDPKTLERKFNELCESSKPTGDPT